ncbi:GDP-mannose 4,6-dehydratase [Candidatus Nitrospira bockiana]
MEGLALKHFFSSRPVLVTGGTGLVGGWVVKRLVELGSEVVCLVRDWVPQSELIRSGLLDKIRVVRGDVRDQALLERVLGEYEIHTVIHLAAQTIVTIANRNPISTFETNIGGTWTLLEACRRSPLVKQIIVASSDKAYGDHDTLPYDETTRLQGRHPYDVSKSCADLLAQAYATTYGLPVVIARCANLYGGGDLNWNRIVPGTIRSALDGRSPVIRSDGQYIRDYFYAEDAAGAYLLLAGELSMNEDLAGEAFNFSYELQITVLELVERILSLIGAHVKPDVRNEATNEIRRQYLSAAKARQMLGWKPQYSLDEGLNRTIDWYRRFLGVNV